MKLKNESSSVGAEYVAPDGAGFHFGFCCYKDAAPTALRRAGPQNKIDQTLKTESVQMKMNMKTNVVKLLVVAGLLAIVHHASAQTGDYLYSGSETTITLDPGTYDITAYGAQGGGNGYGLNGGLGAEMSGQFTFTSVTTLILLVGGAGAAGGTDASIDNYNPGGGGGGGGSFVVNGSTPLVVAGGGGGAANVNSGGNGLTTTVGGDGNSGSSYGPDVLNGGTVNYTVSGGTGGSSGAGGGAGAAGLNEGGLGGQLGYGGGGGGGYIGDGSGGGGSSYLNLGGGGSYGYVGGFASGGLGGGGGGGAYDGGGGGGGGYSGGGGGYAGGGNWEIPPFGGYAGGGGGGGGSIIDASAIANLSQNSGVGSPNGGANGEIFITVAATPEPSTLALAGLCGLSLMLFRHQRK